MRWPFFCHAGVVCLAGYCAFGGQTPDSKDAQAKESHGIPVRATPGEYQGQAKAGNVTIAADFDGHSIPRPEGPLSTDDYVVVEAALFGADGAHLSVVPGNFRLRVNGKKQDLQNEPYGFVLRSVKDPSWSPPEDPEAKKSKNGLSTGVQDDSSLPKVVHVPIELQRAMAQSVRKSAMPEGDRPLPEAGLIYFAYRGKTSSIHSLELTYDGPAGKATLELQP